MQSSKVRQCIAVLPHYVHVWHTSLSSFSQLRKRCSPPLSLFGQLLWREFFYTAATNNPNFDRMEGNPICVQVGHCRFHSHVTAHVASVGFHGVVCISSYGLGSLSHMFSLNHTLTGKIFFYNSDLGSDNFLPAATVLTWFFSLLVQKPEKRTLERATCVGVFNVRFWNMPYTIQN